MELAAFNTLDDCIVLVAIEGPTPIRVRKNRIIFTSHVCRHVPLCEFPLLLLLLLLEQ